MHSSGAALQALDSEGKHIKMQQQSPSTPPSSTSCSPAPSSLPPQHKQPPPYHHRQPPPYHHQQHHVQNQPCQLQDALNNRLNSPQHQDFSPGSKFPPHVQKTGDDLETSQSRAKEAYHGQPSPRMLYDLDKNANYDSQHQQQHHTSRKEMDAPCINVPRAASSYRFDPEINYSNLSPPEFGIAKYNNMNHITPYSPDESSNPYPYQYMTFQQHHQRNAEHGFEENNVSQKPTSHQHTINERRGSGERSGSYSDDLPKYPYNQQFEQHQDEESPVASNSPLSENSSNINQYPVPNHENASMYIRNPRKLQLVDLQQHSNTRNNDGSHYHTVINNFERESKKGGNISGGGGGVDGSGERGSVVGRGSVGVDVSIANNNLSLNSNNTLIQYTEYNNRSPNITPDNCSNHSVDNSDILRGSSIAQLRQRAYEHSATIDRLRKYVK